MLRRLHSTYIRIFKRVCVILVFIFLYSVIWDGMLYNSWIEYMIIERQVFNFECTHKYKLVFFNLHIKKKKVIMFSNNDENDSPAFWFLAL